MVRFHAIALIPDSDPVVNNNKLNDGYETDINQEMTNVEDDNKIKKKGDKPKVWDLIKAQCEDLAIPKGQKDHDSDIDMEVSVTSFKIDFSSKLLFDQVCKVEPTTCMPLLS